MVGPLGERGLMGGEEVGLTEFEVIQHHPKGAVKDPRVEEIEEAIYEGDAGLGDEPFDECAGDHLGLAQAGDGLLADIGQTEGIEDNDGALIIF